ncbi:hypothetical protein DXG01_001369 [Tephrocybe rancida]|nr:hypothetical protein DXG01_001369 [Tephrocybe rancida]
MQAHATQTTVDQVDDILEMFYTSNELLDYDEQEDLAFYELYDDSIEDEFSASLHSYPVNSVEAEEEWEELLDLLVSGSADTNRFEDSRWSNHAHTDEVEVGGVVHVHETVGNFVEDEQAH